MRTTSAPPQCDARTTSAPPQCDARTTSAPPQCDARATHGVRPHHNAAGLGAPPRCGARGAGRLLLRVAPWIAALAATAIGADASAYPSCIVFAPSGEALPFGSFALGAYGGMLVSPEVGFGSAWGGLNIGVLPSLDIVKTSAGTLAFAGAEVGLDVFGPAEDGSPAVVFNAKIQLIKDATYWPAVAIGFFQVSPDAGRGAMLGYFSLSKSLYFKEIELGQLTFGMLMSFADNARIAPQCFVSGAPFCLFRGTTPFEDKNGAFMAGYLSPWFGPVGVSVDYIGGTSAVSSANTSVNFRLWEDETGGFALVGVGGFFSTDRRDSPPGPGAADGIFIQGALISSLAGLFGWDPTKEWTRDPKKPRSRRGRREIEDPFDAPPLKPPDAEPPEKSGGEDMLPEPTSPLIDPGPSAPPTGPSAPPTEPGAPSTAPSAPPTEPGAPPTAPGAPPTAPGAPSTAPSAPPTESGAPPTAPPVP